jgi:hypothetical protein
VLDSNPHSRCRPDLCSQNRDPRYDRAGGMLRNDSLRPGCCQITWMANGNCRCHFQCGHALFNLLRPGFEGSWEAGVQYFLSSGSDGALERVTSKLQVIQAISWRVSIRKGAGMRGVGEKRLENEDHRA